MKIVELFSPPHGEHVVAGSWIFSGSSNLLLNNISSQKVSLHFTAPHPNLGYPSLHFTFRDHEARGKYVSFARHQSNIGCAQPGSPWPGGSTRLCLAGSAPSGFSSTDLARLASITFGLAWLGLAPFVSRRLGPTRFVSVWPAGVRFALILRRWMSIRQVWDRNGRNVD